jgi:CHAD domain-containing protein
VSANLEREAKLQVPVGFRLPDLGGDGLEAVARPAERLVTTYVDTPDLRIARWGSSLRHRRGEGWTVKLPAAGEGGSLLARREHVFEGDDARKLPVAAADLVRAFVRGSELAPVARLQTKRTGIELKDGSGRRVEVVTDDEVSVMDGRRVGARFREVEVELDPEAPADVAEALVARLREAGAGSVENVSKLRRALGPVADEGPDVVIDELEDDVTIVRVVRRALAASAARLIVHDPGVRLGDDPEDVHQARVATRRLRSDLRTFRDFLDTEWAQPLRDELKWLGSALGAVRDAEVLRERLRSRASRLPEAERSEADDLIADLEARRIEARDGLLGSMREPRYVEILDAVVEAAHDPRVVDEAASSPAREALAPVLERPWKHLETAIDGLDADPSDEGLHAARIRAKRVRYAAEAVAPVFGKTARKFAGAAEDLQDVLGEHQDAVVAGGWLREARTGTHAFVAGELAAFETEAAGAARADWPAAWKALARKRLRFWA